MLFSSPSFLFVFLPLFLAGYALLPAGRRAWLLGASLLFYAWSEPIFLGVVLCSAGLDYHLGQRLVRLDPASRARRLLVTAGVVGNVGLLVVVKYSGFVVENLNALTVRVGLTPWPVPHFILPLGISFIVFEKLTYVVDLHRGEAPPARSFRDYLAYVFLFPKLLAGPIVKYHEIAAQIARSGPLRFEDVRDGLLRFVWGLSKKVLLADALAGGFVDQIFQTPANELTPATAWLGIGGFWLQLFFDFSGYSDMAIGLGRALGFRLRENFDHPFLSESVSEFWRRWHISLGSWVREYLYQPLTARDRSRRTPGRRTLNLFLCMLVIGLWHGAAWTFVLWGACHGAILGVEAAYGRRWRARLPRLVNIAVTLFLVLVTGTFFRCPSASQTLEFLATMFGRVGPMAHPVILRPDAQVALFTALALVFAPLLRGWLPAAGDRGKGLMERGSEDLPAPAAVAPAHRVPALAFGLLLLLVCLGRIAVSTFHPFIYFRF